MKPKEMIELLRETLREWYADNTFQLGAALAFYSVFSLAPILIIAIAVASLVFGEEAARGHITEEIRGTAGKRVAEAIQETLKQSSESGSGALATVFGVSILLFTATAVFSQLQQALNTVWGVQTRPGRSWVVTIKDRFWSFTVVLGIGFLLLVSLIVSTALTALSNFLTPSELPGGLFLWQTVHSLISFGFIALLFAMIYKLLPDVRITWRDVAVGAGVTALLFSAGKHLIGLYLANSSWISAYGAAGSLVVVLLWVYYSAQIFLLGAEFTQVYANKYGRPLVAEDRAEPMTEEARARQGMTPIKKLGGPPEPGKAG